MGKVINQDDSFFVAGHRGMAGSAICRALKRSGYENLLTASRDELDLLDLQAVQQWFADNKPTVVVLAAAKVGGIHANDTYPADFLLENLKIQTNVIETAWRSGVKRLLFLGSYIYPVCRATDQGRIAVDWSLRTYERVVRDRQDCRD